MFFWKSSEEKQYKDFQMDEDSITYKGKRHSFSEITHLHFTRVVTRYTTTFLYAEFNRSNEFTLYIYLSDGSTITLGFAEKYASMMKENIEYLSSIYQFLSQKTFAQRLQFYMGKVTERGYFMYGGCKFYPKEQKIIFKKKEFPIKSSALMRGAGFVELRPEPFTMLERIKRQTVSDIPQFLLWRDIDVIFHILDKSFGLKWE